MVTHQQAIQAVLNHSGKPDLVKLYTPDMEVQVMVAQGDGERISGVYKGKRWHGYSDGLGNTWKPFRIPRNADSDPVWEDKEINFDLGLHAEAIGLTGWGFTIGFVSGTAAIFTGGFGGSGSGTDLVGSQ